MAASLSPHGIDLVQTALLDSFWRRDALKRFLRRCGIREDALYPLAGEMTKRLFLESLFPRIERSPKGPALLLQMARALAEQESFPDLEGWEDSRHKVARAKESVAALRAHLEQLDRAVTDENERRRLREVAAERRLRCQTHAKQLNLLKCELEELAISLGTQSAGYAFQEWFAKLCSLFEVSHKKPYRVGTREIDGSITLDGTTYILSLKFTASAVPPNDVGSFRDRVLRGADNTMGLLISASGFTNGAVDEAAGPKTPILLLTIQHLFLILQGAASLPEVVDRVRRHASRTGEAYLPVDKFGD